MKHKHLSIILITLITTMLLTACGETTAQQKEQWSKATAQIESLQKTLTDKVKETSDYYNSINDEVKSRMVKIDFSSFVMPEDDNTISIPKKEKEFDQSFDTLQQKTQKINDAINSVPKIEVIKQQQEETTKQMDEEKAKTKADADEKERLAKENSARKITETTAKQNTASNNSSIPKATTNPNIITSKNEYLQFLRELYPLATTEMSRDSANLLKSYFEILRSKSNDMSSIKAKVSEIKRKYERYTNRKISDELSQIRLNNYTETLSSYHSKITNFVRKHLSACDNVVRYIDNGKGSNDVISSINYISEQCSNNLSDFLGAYAFAKRLCEQ